jgi:GNAT superfamily N-acetyltransferase
MSEINILSFAPGTVGEVVRAHAAYYGLCWDFDARFEAQVSRELGEFVREFDVARDGFWRAECDGEFAGGVAVDGSRSGEGEARLRWFIVPESFHGKGIGSRLFDTAMDFCRERGFHTVYLWTFAGLDAARALYERGGFRLVEETEGDGWGPVITEQKFVLSLRPTP